MSQWPPQPVQLVGQKTSLRPLQADDEKGISEVVEDGELWRLWYTSVPTPDAVLSYIEKALAQQAAGLSLPFAIIDQASGKIIGCTRYCNIESDHLRLEIGYTFYAKSYQRTAANSEAKFLLLKHAFDSLKVNAVEFRTHWHNKKSRAAIERLGAKQDGVLRNHRVMADGSLRDTVVYSIIREEWPSVRNNLHFLLQS